MLIRKFLKLKIVLRCKKKMNKRVRNIKKLEKRRIKIKGLKRNWMNL
jgi:ribosomal protein S30